MPISNLRGYDSSLDISSPYVSHRGTRFCRLEHEGDFTGDATSFFVATEKDISIACGPCSTLGTTLQPTESHEPPPTAAPVSRTALPTLQPTVSSVPPRTPTPVTPPVMPISSQPFSTPAPLRLRARTNKTTNLSPQYIILSAIPQELSVGHCQYNIYTYIYIYISASGHVMFVLTVGVNSNHGVCELKPQPRAYHHAECNCMPSAGNHSIMYAN